MNSLQKPRLTKTRFQYGHLPLFNHRLNQLHPYLMRFILLSAIFVGSFARATEPLTSAETDHYFVYPRATLVAKSGRDSLVSELSRNYSQPTKAQPEPHFSSGGEFQNGASVGWELVRRTEHGDVYLIFTQLPHAKPVVTPVLFCGRKLIVSSADDLTVEIWPERPKDEK